MKKKHNALRAIIFTLITVIILNLIGRYISIYAVNNQLFFRMADYYFQPKDSMDVVVVGPSSTYAFWEPNTAWHDYGITCYPYSTPQQPLAATRFVLEECRKTQPNSLYLININLFLVEEITPAMIHFLSDPMPPSLTRHRMIQYLCKLGGFTTIDRQVEYYSPIFAMHDRWKRVHLPPKGISGHGVMGASVVNQFMTGVTDMTNGLYFTDERHELKPLVQQELDLLLEYLEDEDINAAFFLSPSRFNAEAMAAMNTVVDEIRDAGYTLYSGFEEFDQIGLYLPTDYMDASHTNIAGAKKFTKWLARRLVEDYGFEDKRGDPAYAAWDESRRTYERIIIMSELYR